MHNPLPYFELIALQLEFLRYIPEQLGTDDAGLTTMIHLLQAGHDSPKAIAGANLA